MQNGRVQVVDVHCARYVRHWFLVTRSVSVDLLARRVFVSRWAIAPVIDGLVVLETGAIALRLKGCSRGTWRTVLLNRILAELCDQVSVGCLALLQLL